MKYTKITLICILIISSMAFLIVIIVKPDNNKIHYKLITVDNKFTMELPNDMNKETFNLNIDEYGRYKNNSIILEYYYGNNTISTESLNNSLERDVTYTKSNTKLDGKDIVIYSRHTDMLLHYRKRIMGLFTNLPYIEL